MICRRCEGTGMHNIPPAQFQHLKRCGKRPASCTLCAGTGVRNPYVARAPSGRVNCIFVYYDGSSYPVDVPCADIPDMGKFCILENLNEQTVFVLSSVNKKYHLFRQYMPLSLVLPSGALKEKGASRSQPLPPDCA